MYNPNDYYFQDGSVVYPEEKIDLFDISDIEDIPKDSRIEYRDIEDYADISYVVFDIETTGVDWTKDKIYMIGLKNEKGRHLILKNKNEKELLQEFFHIMQKKKPDYLFGYNIQSFDLPFIYHRASKYMGMPGIVPSYWHKQNKQLKQFNQAKLFGKPIRYLPYKFFGELSSVNIIDLYHQVLAYDNVKRKLTSHTLKNVVLQYKLRKERRLELKYDEMMAHYDNWMNNDVHNVVDIIAKHRKEYISEIKGTNVFNELKKKKSIDIIQEYCAYDLDDTELIADMIVPSIHYQGLLFNWRPDQNAVYGTGFKWNSVCSDYYGENIIRTPDAKCSYKGAFTFANPGLFRNAAQIDISSAYPFTQLLHRAYDYDKDPDMVVIKWLAKVVKDRMFHKNNAENDIKSKYLADALKIIANSGYGFYGTTGLEYNSMGVAAFIAAVVSKLVKFIKSRIEYYGGVVFQVDTDGLIFCALGNYSPAEIHENVQNDLPSGYEIGLDWLSDAVFVPINEDGVGIKKNYIVFSDGKIIKQRGKINNRERCLLEKKFTTTYVKKIVYEGYAEAQDYYKKLIRTIKKNDLDITDIQVTQTVRSNDKKFTQTLQLVEKGAKTVTWYMGYSKEDKQQEVSTGNYHKMFYVDMVQKIKRMVDTSNKIGNLELLNVR
ncbi:MAG: hypothetical protein F6K34_01160 [Okeania sp. SIO4D6]|uniref:3'-5' exonuclease n=1 Tax=unclassified Okeania TaxID=2634635 RepID=UPI0013B61E8C|nr:MULTISPECIES: 3'-5' exonuclease [unclassified Okeania]NEP03538.1 hypothetical protein [Okeania sp. SIO4D6]NEP76012.1 hypothetical protein [Okeania sp. SIO2G5]NEP96598.1 hypothetical protein [Okeania sp. SIO2F5]